MSKRGFGFLLSRLSLSLVGSAVVLACAAAPNAGDDPSASTSEAVLGGFGTGTTGGNTTGTVGSSCPVNTVLECGGGMKNGVCILPSCVALDPGAVTPPPCGVMGSACCGGANGTCAVSYAACVAGTCTPCGNSGEPTCSGGMCFQGVKSGGSCVSCADAGAVAPPTVVATSPYSGTVTYHFTQPVGAVAVTLTNTMNPQDVRHVYAYQAPGSTTATVTFDGLAQLSSYNVTSSLGPNCAPALVTLSTPPCGVAGELACVDGPKCSLADLVVDASGKCAPCGHDNLPTCDNGRCDVGFVGHDGKCPACGHLGQYGCAADPPCGPRLDVNGQGICQTSCGQEGQQCCDPSDACDDGLKCVDNIPDFWNRNCHKPSNNGTGGFSTCTNGPAKDYTLCMTCTPGYPKKLTVSACSVDAALTAAVARNPGCTVDPVACTP